MNKDRLERHSGESGEGRQRDSMGKKRDAEDREGE